MISLAQKKHSRQDCGGKLDKARIQPFFLLYKQAFLIGDHFPKLFIFV